MNTLLAWHNDPALKAEVLSRMLQHRVEDSITQGIYQEWAPDVATQYRGCLIGCTLPMQKLEGSVEEYFIPTIAWHLKVEQLYGIPVELNYFFDGLFEALPQNKAAWFAVSTIEAIPVGADLLGVGALLAGDMGMSAETIVHEQREYGPNWLENFRSDYLGEFSRPGGNLAFFNEAVRLAELLLEYLAEAPVSVLGTSGGVQLTDEIIQALADEAEAGYEIGNLNSVPTPEEINV